MFPFLVFSYANSECKKFSARCYLAGTLQGLPRIDFYASKKIPQGGVITFRYSKSYFNQELKCLCSTCVK